MAFISDENSQVLLSLFKQNMIMIILSCDCSVDTESTITHDKTQITRLLPMLLKGD